MRPSFKEDPVRRTIIAVAFVSAILAGSGPLLAEDARFARPLHTFSIVARDEATGEMGVAVQSHWFSVGSVVPWAEPGVGAVATQSFVEASYGPLGLALMRDGRSAPEALAALLAKDEHQDVRQVAMIDSTGKVAAHTGSHCIAAAGHRTGSGFSAQANLMADASVWPAMADAFERSKGDLAERMLAALEAAQRAGGDIRGRQSAALIVVGAKRSATPWKDRLFDLRVDDHPDPIVELRRLVGLARAYRVENAGDDAVTENRAEDALKLYSKAEEMVPGSDEFVFWHAVALVSMKRVDESIPVFARCFRMNAAWLALVPRLPGSGLLPDDPAILARILSAGPRAR